MKRLFLLLLLGGFLAFAVEGDLTHDRIFKENLQSEEANARFGEFIKALDFDHFASSFELDVTKWSTCGDELLSIPGFAVSYDEPLWLADFSKEPLKIQSLGISLSDDPSKSGYTRKRLQNINMFGFVNIIQFPLLGMIFDQAPELCLQSDNLSLAYLSALDPLYDGMYTRMVFADIDIFFKPEMMLLGLTDCLASSVSEYTSGLSSAAEYNAQLRMFFPHYFGCWNAFPMGGWSAQADPIAGAATAIGFGLASMTRAGMITKSINIPGLEGDGGLPATMCGPRTEELVFIKPQFLFQLVYPTPSSVVPLGATPAEWSEFKNNPQSVDNAAFWVWKRKMIYMGAAKCSQKK